MTINRYPWDKAPEWANYAATDDDGDLWFYENKPDCKSGVWLADGPFYRFIDRGPPCARPAMTLEQRPRVAE